MINPLNNKITPLKTVSVMFASLTVSSYVLLTTMSYAAMFQTEGSELYLSSIIGAYLVATIIALLITSVFSTSSFAVSTPQALSTATFTIVIAQIVHYSSLGSIPEREQLATIMFVIASSTFLTGIIIYLISLFKKTNLIRYIPYPMIGGYLAGIGGAIVYKSVQMAFYPSNEQSLYILAVAILFSIAAVLMRFISEKGISVVYVLISCVAIFYSIIWAKGISIQNLAKLGWFVHSVTTNQMLTVQLTAHYLNLVNWHIIWMVLSPLLVAIATNVLIAYMAELSIQGEKDNEVDLDREISLISFSNIISGLFGGAYAATSSSHSLLAREVGASSKLCGLMGVALIALLVIFKVNLISYIPKSFLIGTLMYVATGLLIQGLYVSYFDLTTEEYIILVLMFLITCFGGFVLGFVVGLVLMAVAFVVNYTRIDPIRYVMKGDGLRSNKARSAKDELILQRGGGATYYLKLQGYIFFATAYRLLEDIQNFVNKMEDRSHVKFIIIDFGLVTGCDSSAVQYINRLKNFATNKRLTLAFVSMSDSLNKRLSPGHVYHENFYVFSSPDYALEFCEEKLLEDTLGANKKNYDSFDEFFGDISISAKCLEKLRSYFQKIELDKDEILVAQDAPVEGLFFIESGELSVFYKNGKKTLRLRKIGVGNIVGEMGFYRKRVASASVITDAKCVVQLISRESLAKMEDEAPEIAIAFQQAIIQLVIERLDHRNKQLEALSILSGKSLSDYANGT